MNIKDEIDVLPNGANFVRADLHIHSYGSDGSYDVTDVSMTPENIIDTAVDKNLQIISITDHNSIGNVNRAIDYSKGKSVLVMPGVEISTTQGHLLVYHRDFANLQKFLGKLSISDNKQLCHNGILECLEVAKRFGGFGILAHIELDSGFEKTIGRFGPQLEEIFKIENLLGLEITRKESENFYTSRDTINERKNLLHLRKETLTLDSDYELAKMMSSDAHQLSRLGLNAEGNKKLTRIKVDELSFDSVKIALISSSSRIRIEEFIPSAVPVFVGIKLEGGLLKDQIVRFSNNLTCIIGGRGTGKSTLLEALRQGSGNRSENKLVDCEIWPDKTTVLYRDEANKIDMLNREKLGQTTNFIDPTNGITKIPIESYGQGETADTIQHSDQDPSSLLKFLDSFLEIDELNQQDKELRDALINNQSDQEKLEVDVKTIPDIRKLKSNTDKKLQILKKEKVGEIVTYQESLIKERVFRSELIKDLGQLIKAYKATFSDKELFDKVDSLDGATLIVGKEQFAKVKKIIEEFSIHLDKVSGDLKDELEPKVEQIREQLKLWKAKEADVQGRIDEKRKELEEKGIPFDMGRINKITEDVVYYETKLRELERKEQLLKGKRVERKELVRQRKDVKNRVFNTRNALAARLNKNLKDTISDFYVSIKYKEGLFSPTFEEFIKATMDYRTTQVSKANLIATNITSFDLIEAVRKKIFGLIEKFEDKEGNKLLNKAEVESLYNRLAEGSNLLELESIEFEDRPEILVTKMVEKQGTKTRVSRDFGKLSLGQQQSILLAILLHSKSKNPLIIDQPEDNLDSEFIYKTIVRNLRKIKEQRQVIIVTHNPNIAVLGDAELIIPLKSSSTRSVIHKRGSIDNKETREITCDVLEGGEQAFRKRQEIYGLQ